MQCSVWNVKWNNFILDSFIRKLWIRSLVMPQPQLGVQESSIGLSLSSRVEKPWNSPITQYHASQHECLLADITVKILQLSYWVLKSLGANILSCATMWITAYVNIAYLLLISTMCSNILRTPKYAVFSADILLICILYSLCVCMQS